MAQFPKNKKISQDLHDTTVQAGFSGLKRREQSQKLSLVFRILPI